MAQVATREETAVARPLKVLVPLIKESFERAEQAGMPYFEKAGTLLIEARSGHFKNDAAGFYKWGEDEFGKKRDQISTYMGLAGANNPKSFESLRDFHRRGTRRSSEINRLGASHIRREWTAPVDAVAERAHEEARRLALQDSLTRNQEREAERKLALRLIDIGFKVLAKELHPDKLGGDRDAMARLNRVRKRLQECI